MRRLRFLLRPGWLGFSAAVVLFAVLCFTVLAPWQFHRHDERKASNDALSSALRIGPAPYQELLPDPDVEVPAGLDWREATLTGRYLPDSTAVARLRTVDGKAAFEVLTPLRLTDGTVVLVNRGYIRPDAGGPGASGRVPDFAAPPSGAVTVTGRLRRDEVDPQNREAFTDGGRRQVYAINAATVGRAAGLTIRPGYVQLVADQPGVLGPLPLPQLTAGPYLAYAWQWLAFGVMAPLAWVLMVRRELRDPAVPGQPARSAPSARPAPSAQPTRPARLTRAELRRALDTDEEDIGVSASTTNSPEPRL